MRRERLTAPIWLVLPVVLASALYAVARPAVGARSGAAVSYRACEPEGYGVSLQGLPKTSSRQPEVVLTAGWLSAKEHGHACVLDTTIHLSISDANGVAASADLPVHAVLRPWGSVEHTWAWQNWCGPGGPNDVSVTADLPDGESYSQLVPDPPTCTNAAAATTLTDVGTGPAYAPIHGNRIPPHILPRSTPSPLPHAVIAPRNAWLVSDGYTLVAVYAGAFGIHPSYGRFAIIRQNLIFGLQYSPPEIVNVGKIGAIRITRAPRGASRETTAQRGKLAFVSADGTKGVLDLYGDRVRITVRR